MKRVIMKMDCEATDMNVPRFITELLIGYIIAQI